MLLTNFSPLKYKGYYSNKKKPNAQYNKLRMRATYTRCVSKRPYTKTVKTATRFMHMCVILHIFTFTGKSINP